MSTTPTTSAGFNLALKANVFKNITNDNLRDLLLSMSEQLRNYPALSDNLAALQHEDRSNRISSIINYICSANPDVCVPAYLNSANELNLGADPQLHRALAEFAHRSKSRTQKVNSKDRTDELEQIYQRIENLGPTFVADVQKAIKDGIDTRLDFYDFPAADKNLSLCVISLWHSAHVKNNHDGTYTLQTGELSDKIFDDKVRFLNQPRGAFATAFLTKDQQGNLKAITTGHSFANEAEFKDTYFVFGFKSQDFSTVAVDCKQLIVPEVAVYKGAALVRGGGSGINRVDDWASVTLDRPVDPQFPPAVLSSTPLSLNQTIRVFGHPIGLPLKRGHGTAERWMYNDWIMYTDLPTFGGNSGSPVFNDSNEVVGILRGGQQDFEKSKKSGKLVEIIDYATGEEQVILSSVFASLM